MHDRDFCACSRCCTVTCRKLRGYFGGSDTAVVEGLKRSAFSEASRLMRFMISWSGAGYQAEELTSQAG
jgi:hypothetical protein